MQLSDEEIQEMSNAWEGSGGGGEEGVRDGHVCIYLSNKEQSLYRILTLFMISSLDEIKLQLLQQQKLCDEPFNFLLSNHARVMQSLSFFLL